MKASKLIAIIFLLPVSIFPTFGSAENLFIDTPLQEIEFHKNLPLPKTWRVCYPNCNNENKIEVNLMNNEGSFFSIEQLHFFEEDFFEVKTIKKPGNIELLFQLKNGLAHPISKLSYNISRSTHKLELKISSSEPISIKIRANKTLLPENIVGLGGLYNGTSLISFSPKGIEEMKQASILNDSEKLWHGARSRFWSFLISPSKAVQSYSINNIETDSNSFALNSNSDSGEHHFIFYFGPIERSALVSVSSKLQDLLYTALWNWLRWICFGFQTILSWVFSWVGNLGISIILLALIIKIFLYPLSSVAEKWQQEVNEIQAWLQPRLNNIKTNYTGEEAHRMTLALYQEKDISPMFTVKSLAGLLIQIPVFIAVFDMLGESIILKGQDFLWINDLSRPDHWISLPFAIPYFGGKLNLLPLLMMVITVLSAYNYQDKHLQGALRKQQQIKLYFMALAFFILFYTFPAGMVLYWTASNSIQLIKTLVVKYKT